MADALKDMFNKGFYEHLALEFNKVDTHFLPAKFVMEVTKDLAKFSLNERMHNTSFILKKNLLHDYKKSVEIMFKVIPNVKTGYTSLIFPDFIGLFGHNDFHISMEALKYFTLFGSSEFAIREFLKRDFTKTIKVMNGWATDKNQHVRRLASEGSRPRLPWSFKLNEVIKNPKITQSILEKLNSDKELYVRKSVANHLNDISKDNSEWMLQLLKSWDNKDSNTAWITKHACRTLIKKGNVDSLALFNFEKNVGIKAEKLKLNKLKLQLGESLQFEFDLISKKVKSQKLVIDFIIHYHKKNNELSPKVFKLKEINLPGLQCMHISKTHRFQNYTTRKHYPGKHGVEIMINGKSYLKKEFFLSI